MKKKNNFSLNLGWLIFITLFVIGADFILINSNSFGIFDEDKENKIVNGENVLINPICSSDSDCSYLGEDFSCFNGACQILEEGFNKKSSGSGNSNLKSMGFFSHFLNSTDINEKSNLNYEGDLIINNGNLFLNNSGVSNLNSKNSLRIDTSNLDISLIAGSGVIGYGGQSSATYNHEFYGNLYINPQGSTSALIIPSGNVGIGTEETPESLLYLYGGDLKINKGNIFLDNSGTSFINSKNSLRIDTSNLDISLIAGSGVIGYGGQSSATYNHEFYGNLYINPQGSTSALIIPSGNVGIGTENPETTLVINGPIKLLPINLPSCTSYLYGSLARNNTGVYYCNSEGWIAQPYMKG